MKIRKIVISEVEVPDDYRMNPTEIQYEDGSIVCEADGDSLIFCGYEVAGYFGYMSVGKEFDQPATVMQKFMYWLLIAWMDFYVDPNLPTTIRKFLMEFAGPLTEKIRKFAGEHIKKRQELKLEINNKMINFKDWDVEIFLNPMHRWSKN